MAVIVGRIVVDLAPIREQIDAAQQSLASLAQALSPECISDALDGSRPDLSVLLDNAGDLFGREPVFDSTPVTGKLESIQVQPSDRYVELVSAIAADGDQYSVRVAHGWPILSVVARNSTVAEAGGAASALGGGVA